MRAKAIITVLPYRIKDDMEERIYKDYMARCARLITENTARSCRGSYMKCEYADLLKPKPPQMTAEEIIEEVARRAGIEVI